MHIVEYAKRRRFVFAALTFAVALVLRLVLFFTVYDDLRHGTALYDGSSAIGLFFGDGLSYSESEMERIAATRNNFSGDYTTFYAPQSRDPSTEFLPGPAILLSGLWRIMPIHNFSPYLVLQSILESILIALFAIVFIDFQPVIALITTVLLVFNFPAIVRTLMMGYDFWPQFAVLVLFIGMLSSIRFPRAPTLLALCGILVGIAAWFRSITVFLPFVTLTGMTVTWLGLERRSLRTVAVRSSLFLVPVILLVVSLSVYRYETTGNWRPTRSTFWHTFFAGVGEFSNPFGLVNDDTAVWHYGQRLNPALRQHSLREMYKSPNSEYELTLKREAMDLVQKRPLLLVRNTAYRLVIMISPPLYSGGDFVPQSISRLVFPIGILMIPVWFLGMLRLWHEYRPVFWLVMSIYLYFFVAFSWFYVVGRVILPFLFISAISYLNGLAWIREIARTSLGQGVTRVHRRRSDCN